VLPMELGGLLNGLRNALPVDPGLGGGVAPPGLNDVKTASAVPENKA